MLENCGCECFFPVKRKYIVKIFDIYENIHSQPQKISNICFFVVNLREKLKIVKTCDMDNLRGASQWASLGTAQLALFGVFSPKTHQKKWWLRIFVHFITVRGGLSACAFCVPHPFFQWIHACHTVFYRGQLQARPLPDLSY